MKTSSLIAASFILSEKRIKREIFKPLLVVLAVFTFCVGSVWAGEVTVNQQDSPIVTAQIVKPKKPKQFKPVVGPLKQLKFDRYEHGDVEMSPATLTIRYGGNVLHINQGQTKYINIPEDSPLLDYSDGLQLQAIVEYRLKNKTTKRLRFRVGPRYGNNVIAHEEVIFFGQQTKNIQHNVKLAPSSGPLLITVEGLNILNYPDDTRPLFFHGRLLVRVYPL